MTPDPHSVTELLKRTGHAHGQYETTVLKGVYDQNWAPWYADWAIQHGLNDLLGSSYSADTLGQLLYEINQDHQRYGAGQSWAEYTAARLTQLKPARG